MYWFIRYVLFAGIVLIDLVACGSGSTSSGNISTPTENIVTVVVDSGYNGKAINIPFVTVTICQSGTNNCQLIDHIQLDTGSTGLRINQSAIKLNGLTPVTFNNSLIYQCMSYNGGYAFGATVLADVKLGSEVASNIPIEIINDGSQVNVPSSCLESSNFYEISQFGAKGILGINPNSNPDNTYNLIYLCDASLNCTQIYSPTVIPTLLNINPIAAFLTDNNGAIITLPRVESAVLVPVAGTLTFGLNTQNNNLVPIGINTVLGDPGNAGAGFSVYYDGQYFASIFDSGTGYFKFYSTQFPQCSGLQILDGFYCPTPSPQLWTSEILGYNGSNRLQMALPIVNYDSIIVTPYVVPALGKAESLGKPILYGLPFFFGRSVYLGFKGQSAGGVNTPLGQGPAWGYIDH